MVTKKSQDNTENENWEKESENLFGYREILRKLKENDIIKCWYGFFWCVKVLIVSWK